MEVMELITTGLSASIITLIIKAIIDACTESRQYKRELKKIVFQRKTDAVEKAMSWFQETIDCYSMMQMGYNELGTKFNPVAIAKIDTSLKQAAKLYDESSTRLNQIYIYYDFSDVEYIFGTKESMELINKTIASIAKLDQDAMVLRSAGKTDESPEIQQLQKRVKNLFKKLTEHINIQRSSVIEMQNIIRQEYKSYLE